MKDLLAIIFLLVLASHVLAAGHLYWRICFLLQKIT